jgi:predicted nucleotidyltransferase component of viral defense system
MKKAFKEENDLDLEITKDESISEDGLEIISEKDFLNGLSDIYYNQENYCVLYIDEDLHQIKVKVKSPEETQEKINKNSKPETKPKKT